MGAIGASPAISTAVASTEAELREEMDDQSRWSEVESQLRAMLRGVEGANLIRRHRLGLKALQAYGILRQLVRQPEHRDLLQYYETLKQMNKLGKRKKKGEEEAEETPK